MGVPSTSHNALDKSPAPKLDLNASDQQQAPPPDETGGGDPNESTQNSASAANQAADDALNRFAGDLNGIPTQIEEQQHREVVDHMKREGFVIWAWLKGKAAFGESQTQIYVKEGA